MSREEDDPAMEATLDLLRRLPPSNIQQNLAALAELMPEQQDRLASITDQILVVAYDEAANREFICCVYNQDGASYRSPWTNQYYPALENGGGAVPDEDLRSFEKDANEVFNEYRRMYYGGGVSSVYLWRIDGGFAACFAIKKEVDGESYTSWDISHVVRVEDKDSGAGESFNYHLCTALRLTSQASLRAYGGNGSFDLGSNIHRTTSETLPFGEGHLVNIGKMIERVETSLRSMMTEVYIGKIRDAVHVVRVPEEDIRPRGL